MTVGEWDQRQLCPDGACVGVIGPDGTCKVCGHVAPNWGDERNRGLLPAEAAEAEAEDHAVDPEDAASDEDNDEEYEDDDDVEYDDEDGGDDEDLDEADAEPGQVTAAVGWGDRQLCPDGTCIGVIGDDGRCGTCGRLAEGAVPKLAIEVEITDVAVQTTDAVVQTAEENVKTDAAPPSEDDIPEGAEPVDPDGKRA